MFQILMNSFWQIMTRADLGLADAYINGDFSFVDKDEGLLNFFLVSIFFFIFQLKNFILICQDFVILISFADYYC